MSLRWLAVVALVLAAAPTLAATVIRVDIRGLKDEQLQANVRSALSLQQVLDKPLSERRLQWLLREAEDETQRALEPFGYYAASVTVDHAPVADAPQQVVVRVTVNPGTPVRVRNRHVQVSGAASADALLQEAMEAFAPQVGDVLDHGAYEASKTRISRALAAHGYFDAELQTHRVEVTRAQQAADILLQWESGPRYSLGVAAFSHAPSAVINDALLHKLVGWTPGDAYDADLLERLRDDLVALDYFGMVQVLPQPEQAAQRQVPVQVELRPAPRTIQTYGLSYGSLIGAGYRWGLERRYLNRRGHKLRSQLEWAEKRKSATVQYRIPAFGWRNGWYALSLQAADEQTRSLDSRRLEAVFSRSGRYNAHLNLTAAAHALRERWLYLGSNRSAPDYQLANFLYASLRAEYIDVDNRLMPRRGAGSHLLLRGGTGNGTGFLQLHASASWFHGFNPDSRLIVRGEAGRTFTGEVLAMPPSLRFFAGGDRSVRGYGWREIGPRLRNSVGDTVAVGAANVVTASVEYEHYFHGPWGAAVFVDTGDAFDGRDANLHTGVGIGLRWRSPVGPVRIDIARGLKSPDSPFTLHLNIGADL